jgi:L-lactate utilization protein LutC
MDPFKLVPADKMADIADKFTRNEILSKNEIREIVGRKPSKDPKADELINSNIAQPAEAVKQRLDEVKSEPKETSKENLQGENQNGEV